MNKSYLEKSPPIPIRPCLACSVRTSNLQDVNGITCSIECRESVLDKQRNEKNLRPSQSDTSI